MPTTAPWSPKIRSLPALPEIVSLAVPPKTMSLPALPSITSLPPVFCAQTLRFGSMHVVTTSGISTPESGAGRR